MATAGIGSRHVIPNSAANGAQEDQFFFGSVFAAASFARVAREALM
jgi:hypothetical protein